jgi:hypothetical protein
MASEREGQEGKGFKVEDRRRFSPATGEPRETAPGENAAQPSEAKASGAERVAEGAGAKAGLPEISFSAFLISLSTQALMHLGEMANPLSGKVEVDIPGAKQLIDIIGVLRDKTRGNLDSGEEKLMEDVLFDLRMRYVEAVKKK